VFAAPDGSIVARVTPWDPGYLLYTRVCLQCSQNAYLPHIEQVSPLVSGGYVVLMERLQPADPERARAFCRALGIANDTGDPAGETDWMTAAVDSSAFNDDKDLTELRQILREAMNFGAAQIPFWGGSDIGIRDVMVTPLGQLKLLDPFFIRGSDIANAVLGRRVDLLQSIPLDEIESSLRLPVLEARYPGYPDPDELRRILRELMPGTDEPEAE
jgi:hypothetical protein